MKQTRTDRGVKTDEIGVQERKIRKDENTEVPRRVRRRRA